MPAPIIQELRDQMARATTVIAGATTFVRGVPALIAKAKAEALENGASAEELAPFTELEAALENGVNDLTAALTENT